jgi:predicted RNA binding protein YcfA (HicA-like mRNA interferase family)
MVGQSSRKLQASWKIWLSNFYLIRQLVATRGSHRQYKHPSKPGRVTIAGRPSHDLAPGTLNSIFKQAQLQRPETGKGK